MTDATAAADQLGAASDRFVGECAGIGAAQWRFRPGPDLWSMAHVTEHVGTSNGNILRLLTTRLLDHPLDGRTSDVLDVEIPYLFYRGDEPPTVAVPGGDWTWTFACEALTTSARSILQWAAGVRTDLRTVAVPHPVFGLLDGVQWLLFAAAHTERHRAQLIGLKGHAAFPR
jgi:DinB family protein